MITDPFGLAAMQVQHSQLAEMLEDSPFRDAEPFDAEQFLVEGDA